MQKSISLLELIFVILILSILSVSYISHSSIYIQETSSFILKSDILLIKDYINSSKNKNILRYNQTIYPQNLDDFISKLDNWQKVSNNYYLFQYNNNRFLFRYNNVNGEFISIPN